MNSESCHPGLYIHLPFCSAICPYCDFSVLTGDARRRRRFLRRLRREIELSSIAPWPGFVDAVPTLPFDTLYLGGGTPSIFDPESLAVLLEEVRSALPVVEHPWIGIEANPEDISRNSLNRWSELGIDFLSVGIQSFESRSLRFLGRRHDASASTAAARLARDSSIETVSFDLIYGLPDQTESTWRADLDQALDLRPDHLSCYQLTFEPGTPFGFRHQRGRLRELPEDRQADLFLLTHRLTRDRGLDAYEVSNFASRPSHRSRHNTKYWRHVPYLGLGPSAHSFAAPIRWWNLRKIGPYERRLDDSERPIEKFERLQPSQLVLERLMLGLRTPSGVRLTDFGAALGERIWNENREWLERLTDADLVSIEDRTIRPTLEGLAITESLVRRFVLPAEG